MHQLRLDTSWGELRLVGGSRAGEGTLVLLPQLRLALDAGRPARALVPMHNVIASHGHLDHLLGVLSWASQRHLQGLRGGTIYAPATIAADVEALVARAAALEGGDPYEVTVTSVAPGDRIAIRPDFTLRFFASNHWVSTIGCCVEWRRRRIRPELAGLLPSELAQRRAAGETITLEVMTPLLAYMSDTGPEAFDREPWLHDVEVLVTECTFLRPADRDRATRFGHTHIDDLVAVAPNLRCRHLVLTHLSRRHRLGEGARRIEAALDGSFAGELHLLNLEWD